MEALFSLTERITLQRWVPWLLALSFFTLPLSSTAKSISLSLTLVAILLTPSYRRELSSLLTFGWCRAALVLFVIAFLACLWSPASYSERLLVLEKYSKLLYLPILNLGFRDERVRVNCLHAFFAALFLTSSLAILKFKGFLPSLNIDPDSLFRNHIIVGYMLDFAAFSAALFAYRQRGFKRLAYGLLFCIFSYHVLFVNGGRMGYLVYFLSLLLLIVQLFSWRQAVIAVLFVCSSLTLIYSQNPFMKERLQLLISQYESYQHQDGNNSVGFRLQFHNYAHSLFNRHPLLGNGSASFQHYFKTENPVPGWGHHLLEPHSQYWLIASEFGIAGLAAFFVFLVSLLKASRNSGDLQPLALAMLLSFIVGCLSDSLLLYSGSGYFFILFMALCLSPGLAKRTNL